MHRNEEDMTRVMLEKKLMTKIIRGRLRKRFLDLMEENSRQQEEINRENPSDLVQDGKKLESS